MEAASPGAGTVAAGEAPGARYPLFSPEWLACASAAFAGLPADGDSAVRVRLCVTDAPRATADTVEITADLATGGLRFRAEAGSERPGLAFTLSHADARTLLLGGQEERTRLFEHGGLRLEGAFLFLFFLDRVLEQDVSGALARLRRRTADPPRSRPPQRGRDRAPGDQGEAGAEAAAVREAADALPGTVAALRAELGRTTPGAQLYVGHAPSGTAVSAAFGQARPGVPFTRRSRPIWYCCSKTVGAVAIGRLWERGLVDPMRPVADYLPWFTGEGREHITLYQMLTHTTPVPMALDPLHGAFAAPVAVRREQVRTMRIPAGEPGRRINYAPWWAWFLLAEVVRAVDGRDYERFAAEEVLRPCAMSDTRMVLTPGEYRAEKDRLPLIHITGGAFPPQATHWYATEAACTRPIHGLNMRGPVRDLGRFFEALLRGGSGPGGRILLPQTTAAMTARHRVGLTDPFGNADWGLGFRVESHHLGEAYTAFSRHASVRTFGHYGLWTSLAFADPDAGLVVALHLNGKTMQDEHRKRTLAVCDAVYTDLGLA
ncbi:serine hydrolase domain-containing protein [Nocardiopsis suaedae]|uniref:Serine hydrolase n=1 Tax=Nocardiopsis suaedae TaxID=3018444 RepID=A0ABT4TQ93_9ACTN|nr:serine hydrolase domain-containing protein [Nocardiopsis suaedae]MDA2806861.1 serine hydrolase [Nocardiopsis suaedae]